MTSAYQQLEAIFSRLHHFSHLASIAGWDQHTMMPAKGNEARSAALAELSVLMHQIVTTSHVDQLIAEAKNETLDAWQQANIREMHRSYQSTVVLPEKLVEAKSLAGARCEHAWRQQRVENNWQGFTKSFKEVVSLSREEAQIRADATGKSCYDALLDLYEPGINSSDLDRIFGDVKQWLPSLLQNAIEKQSQLSIPPITGTFTVEKQRQLSQKVMKLLGFDFDAGRMDVSVHPFCGGVPEDVRITTRYNEDNFLSALMGIIHETGHARYEQNLPRQWLGQPIAHARSTAIHESQSLLFEMQLARGDAFLTLLQPLIIETFGSQPAFDTAHFPYHYRHVKAGLIRIDADEVSYPAHVILRYEIEKQLIEGAIEIEHIPELWDDKMNHYLGVSTQGNYRDGCMQDIHWTDGSFGYFPTYTLGAMYAAQLFNAAHRAIPDLDGKIASGDLSPLFVWLHQNIWQHGSSLDTNALITKATGETLNSRYFQQHLQQRYL